jgi:hypothetical protein
MVYENGKRERRQRAHHIATDGLSLLIRTLSQKAPDIQLDPACERLKNKMMPSIFFPKRDRPEDCPNRANAR